MIVIEVGCHKGIDTIKWLEKGATVYGFEPNPQFIKHLHKNLVQKFPNFNLIEKAVDTTEETKKFNLSGGCSSLFNFVDNLEVLWPDRTNWVVNNTIEVETIRLDTFIKNNNIKKIDYLWIDAQGNDFNILKSLGEYIDIVQEGQCEVSYNLEIYKNTINDFKTVKSWLEEKGFTTHVVVDEWNKEADLYFKK